MRFLVTGARGLLGRHLVEALRQFDEGEVYGAVRIEPSDAMEIRCDLADHALVSSMLAVVRPDIIFHLAGSFSNEFSTDLRNNVCATRNLFEVVAEQGLAPRIIVAGSAAEYGMIDSSSNPVTEDHPTNPVSVYGLTKLFQTQLSLFYSRSKGLDVVIARYFNVLGPGASEKLFVGAVEKQIEAYKEGATEFIKVGNLNSFRDYISAQQAVGCLITLMKSGITGQIYNVGSGVPVRMREILDKMLTAARLDWSTVQVEPFQNESKQDVPVIYADVSKLRRLDSRRKETCKGTE